MADDGDHVLAKLGNFLTGHHAVSQVEFDALISSVSSKEGLVTLLGFTFRSNTNITSLRLSWPLIMAKWGTSGIPIVSEWTKQWKRSVDALSNPSSSVALTFLALLQIVIHNDESLNAAIGGSEDVNKLKELLVSVSALVQAAGQRKPVLRVYRKVMTLIKLKNVFSTLVDMINPQSLEKMASIINVLTLHATFALHKNSDSSLLASLKPKLLDLYAEHIIGAKTTPSAIAIGAFNTLLTEALVNEDLPEKIFPNMERMVRRSPECLPIVSQGISLISKSKSGSLDLSSSSGKLLAAITEYIVNSQEAIRQSAQNIASGICSCIKSSSGLTPLLEKLTPLLNKQLNNWFERQGVFSLVAVVAQSCPVAIEIADTIFPLVLKVVEKEKNKEALASGIEALSSWIKLNPKKFFSQDIVLQVFSKGITDSNKETSQLYLIHLWRSLSEAHLDSSLTLGATITKQLISFIITSKSKPVLGSEALVSMATLQCMAASGNEEVKALFETEKLWSLALAPESFFTSQDPLLHAHEINTTLNTNICYDLVLNLTQSAWKTFLNLRNEPLIWKVFEKSLTSNVPHLRRTCLQSLYSIHKLAAEDTAQFSTGLLNALESALLSASKVHEDARPSPNMFAAILRLSITPGINLNVELPRMVLLANHPFVKGHSLTDYIEMISHAIYGAEYVSPSSSGKEPSTNQLVSKYSNEIISYLCSDQILKSSDHHIVAAGRRAIARLAVSPISQRLIDFIHPMLSYETCKQFLSFSTAQIGIFHTPEGQVYQPIQLDEYIPEIKDNKNVRAKEDDREAKKKAAEAKKKHDEMVQAKYSKVAAEALITEAETRKKVAPIYHQISTGLNILHHIAREHYQVLSENDSFFMTMIIDSIVALARHSTEFQILSQHILQWMCQNCFNSRYLTSPQSHLSSTISKPFDSDLQAQIIEDLDHNSKGAIDATSWALIQPIATHAVTPIVWIKGHGHTPTKVTDKHKGNTESAQHLPRHIQELAFASIDHNKKHVNPALIQCLLTALDSSPSFSDDARTALVESASSFNFNVIPHVHSLEVLIHHLDHQNGNVRLAVLDMFVNIPKLSHFGFHDLVSTRLWKARFDELPDNSDLAVSLYKAYSAEHPLKADYWQYYVPLLSSEADVVREMTAKAIVGAMNLHPETRSANLDKILDLHKSHYVRPDETNAANPRVAIARSQQIESTKEGANWHLYRRGVASVVAQLGQLAELPSEQCQLLFDFLIEFALFESDINIYKAFVDAGTELINLQGAQNISTLLSILEKQLSGKAPQTPIEHRVREAVVIFLGTVVQHLPSTDPRVDGIIQKLLDVLLTPSEPVQRSVAQCLEHIASRMPERSIPLVNHCLKLTLEPGKGGYAHQRGGAWGLAGIVKGMRPISLKQHPFIVERIEAAYNNKQDAVARCGASIALECFSVTLGKGFEPWIIYFLAHLISGLGDGSVDVRETSLEAANAIMSQLSGNGVRLVLPSLLKSLDDTSGKWKAKVGAIELVGAMGHCQPQQLGHCLPTIVPRLSSLLADPHVQVQKVAKEALESICSTIHNPEVNKIVPILLKAIDDPKSHSSAALDALSNTDFVNRIDNASLSLIMPVLDRAIRERASETKKRATKIAGIMCNLTEANALIPYQKALSEQLKIVLADPQPVTRTLAAHALGQLVKGLDASGEIVPYLLDTMKATEVGMIERIGAAQGLAHVASHMDMTGFRKEMLPRILANCENPVPACRQGYLAIFQFLPDTLGSRFEPLLEAILPVVIKGLSDEQDMVRESALASGQAIVKCFGDEKVDVLIPVLQQGLFDKNWRIRSSSIQLLGDLLYQISGAHQDFSKKDISKMLEGNRGSVLASLYLLRLDPVAAVAQQAASVWKMLVVNTPKTLKVLMPTLMSIIMLQLSAGPEEREVASSTLAELVHKMGDRVLGDIIPILEAELGIAAASTRVGICMGIAAVLESLPKHHISEYFDLLLPSITKALCDEESAVRSAAATAFDGLHRGVGDRAINECLPVLLSRMEDEDPNTSHLALKGVQQLLVLRSQLILPILLPKLITLPITAFNARALASIAEVAGPGMYHHLSSIIPILLRLKYTEPEGSPNVPSDPELLTKALHNVILSVEGPGINVLISELSRFTHESSPALRIAALSLFGLYSKVKGKQSPKGWTDYISHIIGVVLKSYHDRDPKVVNAAIAALGDVMSTIDPETVATSTVNYVQTINDTVESLHVPDTLEGFSAPGGLAPLLPIFVSAMRGGSSEMREQVSLGIRNMVSKTEKAALTPSVLQAIAGPLIRILSEPNLESRIRADILSTLNLLVERGGENLKQFATTLQVTYIKAITATFKPTREQAALGVAKLVHLGAKPDFLIKALVPALKTASSTNPDACLSAIAKVYGGLTADVMEATSQAMRDALMPFLTGTNSSEHLVRSRASEAMAFTFRFSSPEYAISNLTKRGLIRSNDEELAESGFLTIHHLLTISKPFGEALLQEGEVIEGIQEGMSEENTAFVRGAAGTALGDLLVYADENTALDFAKKLAEALDEDESIDVKICILNAIRHFAKECPDKTEPLLSILVPSCLQRVKKSMLSLKYAAERALYHLLQIRVNPGLHQYFATTLPETHTKTFLDFCKVVLSKLPEHSDDEESIYEDYTD